MKKKLIIGITALFLLVSAIPAFAALSDAQDKEIGQIYAQIAELRKELVQKYVEAGELSKEQGDRMIKGIDKAEEYRAENGNDYVPYGGCGGAGTGMMDGYNMMGGYYNSVSIEEI